MGTRGPLPNPEARRRKGSARKPSLPVEISHAEELELPVKAPAGLGKAGREVWASLRELDWTQPSDRAGIVRLAELEDERATLREAVDVHGPLLTRPVMTARGDVVGSEVYANPAIRELRRLDAQIFDLIKGFGLTPMARARLGLAVVAAKKDSTLTDLLMAKYRSAASDAPEPEIWIADD